MKNFFFFCLLKFGQAMINLACGDLTRTEDGCNQGNWLLTIGIMCLLELFRRVGRGWGSVDLGEL